MIADHEVEKKRSSDTDPNEHVVSVDSNAFPIPVNPAPDLSLKLAVRFTLFFFFMDIYLQWLDQTQGRGSGF